MRNSLDLSLLLALVTLVALTGCSTTPTEDAFRGSALERLPFVYRMTVQQGNIVTEDLVFLLESQGFSTGVDLERLIAARAVLREGLPDEAMHGQVPRAGIPKTFRRAA